MSSCSNSNKSTWEAQKNVLIFTSNKDNINIPNSWSAMLLVAKNCLQPVRAGPLEGDSRDHEWNCKKYRRHCVKRAEANTGKNLMKSKEEGWQTCFSSYCCCWWWFVLFHFFFQIMRILTWLKTHNGIWTVWRQFAIEDARMEM